MIKSLLTTASAVTLMATASYAQECLTEPGTIGFLPKLDTDPYFQVAGEGAQDAANEIGGQSFRRHLVRPQPKRRSRSSTTLSRKA